MSKAELFQMTAKEYHGVDVTGAVRTQTTTTIKELPGDDVREYSAPVKKTKVLAPKAVKDAGAVLDAAKLKGQWTHSDSNFEPLAAGADAVLVTTGNGPLDSGRKGGWVLRGERVSYIKEQYPDQTGVCELPASSEVLTAFRVLQHYRAVAAALRAGAVVPAEVLADYPDLASWGQK